MSAPSGAFFIGLIRVENIIHSVIHLHKLRFDAGFIGIWVYEKKKWYTQNRK